MINVVNARKDKISLKISLMFLVLSVILLRFVQRLIHSACCVNFAMWKHNLSLMQRNVATENVEISLLHAAVQLVNGK